MRTVYLGQFEEANADKVAQALEEAEISWFAKEAGRLSRFFFADAWGIRLFVDAARIEEARAIVTRSVEQAH